MDTVRDRASGPRHAYRSLQSYRAGVIVLRFPREITGKLRPDHGWGASQGPDNISCVHALGKVQPRYGGIFRVGQTLRHDNMSRIDILDVGGLIGQDMFFKCLFFGVILFERPSRAPLPNVSVPEPIRTEVFDDTGGRLGHGLRSSVSVEYGT